MATFYTAEEAQKAQQVSLTKTLRAHVEPLPPPENAEAFGCLFSRFGAARVVLLGEATHGTAEFYKARAAITRELVQNHGFNIVAVEADWPDAAHLDRYVRHRAPRPGRSRAFSRFPFWMWRNREVMDFLSWLRAHNERRDVKDRASFHGLDVYSLGESIHTVLAYLRKIDPLAAERARMRYGCLTPWQDDPAGYGHAVLYGRVESCEEAIVEQLIEMLFSRLDYIRQDGDDYFDAAQNARVVRAAEHYYRIMYRGGAESWNLRDRHMFDTLVSLLDMRGPESKAVVWAHNSHIGNAAATSMGWAGEFNIGELCKKSFDKDAIAIGFGTDRGRVMAASDWGGPAEIKTVRPAREDSYEFAFRKTGVTRSLTDWSVPSRRALADTLSMPLRERAIGVVYRPESEFLSHYFQAVLSDQFDAYVWFEETSPVTPLRMEPSHGEPDTYPFGL